MSTYDPSDGMSDVERDQFDQIHQLGKYKIAVPHDEEINIKVLKKINTAAQKNLGFRQFIIEQIKQEKTVGDVFKLVEHNRALYEDYVRQGIPLPPGENLDMDMLECGKSYTVVRYWVHKMAKKLGVHSTTGMAGAKPNQFARDYVASFHNEKSVDQLMTDLGISRSTVYKYLALIKKEPRNEEI